MTTYHGKSGAVYVGADAVAEVISFSYQVGSDLVDVSAMGDGAKRYATGMRDGSGSLEANYDPTDTTQRSIRAEATVELHLYPAGQAGGLELTGTVAIENHTINTSKDGVATLSISFKGFLEETPA